MKEKKNSNFETKYLGHKNKTSRPLFTKIFTPGLTFELDNPLDDWLKSTIPTNHSAGYLILGLTRELKVWRIKPLPPNLSATSILGWAVNCESSFKSNSLLTQPGGFQNKTNFCLKNPTFLQPKVQANWACADSTNLKVMGAADITESKMSDIEDIEDILELEFIEAVEKQRKKTLKNRNQD